MHILYATDGSAQARAAGRLLAGLGLAPVDGVTTLAVASTDGPDVEGALSAARKDLSATTAGLTTMAREGYPDEEILKAAAELPADLLVLGAKGASGLARFLLGGVAARVVRYAPCSVLLVRPESASIGRVILAFDGTESARAAAAKLKDFPLPPGAEVLLVSVLPPLDPAVPRREPVYVSPGVDEIALIHELNALRDAFLAAGRRASVQTPRGNPAACLLECAERENADLLVVGAHGSSLAERFHRFLLGSVSERMASYAPCSVLVVKQPGDVPA